MKTNLPSAASRRRGGALVLTAITLVFVGAILATYLLVSQNEYRLVARSQVWNSSIALTEAGVEDALAFMNKYAGNFLMVTNWSTAESAAEDHWTVSNKTYSMHRVLNAKGDYYNVSIDNSHPSSPVITSAGLAAFVLGAAQPQFMLAAAGVSAGTTINRKIEVRTVYSALFPGAITCQTNIDFKGNNVRVDSFDSMFTNASIWITNWGYGIYNISIARANGHVSTDSTVISAIWGGGADIYGHVNTGPGGTTYLQNNGYVGPLPKVGSGIQPGYSSDDMNVVFPPVVLPAGAASWSSIPGDNNITVSGNYRTFEIHDNLRITAPNVTIYVNGNINLSGSEYISVTNSSRVVIYVSGSVDLHGSGSVNNQTKQAGVLGIYGLPSCRSIDMSGNADYTGTIYAPQADFTFGGGGWNTQDYIGALVANSCKLNGKANFHYDESLKRNGPGVGYIPFSWKELSAN